MPAGGQAPKVVEPAEAKNMRLVGFNDLQARSAYQPTIHKQGDRYIAYVGHHGASYDGKPVNPIKGVPEFNGTSIVDVTDPVKPKYLAHIPGAEGGPESRRRADDAGVRRQKPPKRRCERSLPATPVRSFGARNLECRRSGQPQTRRAHRR